MTNEVLRLENTFEDLLYGEVECILELGITDYGAISLNTSEWHLDKRKFRMVRYEMNNLQAMELSNALVNLVRNNLVKK